MDPLIAGTKIEAGQFVKIGPDGKAYPCTEDEDPISQWRKLRPIADHYVVGSRITSGDSVGEGQDGRLYPSMTILDRNVLGYAIYDLYEGDRVKLGPSSRLYRFAPPDPRLSPLA
jgi:hypothetical protein